MPNELIEELDKDGNVLAIFPSQELKKRMFFHRVSLIIPRNKEGHFILGRRAKDKYPFPDTWCCCVGGKALAGESYEDAALREMQEEIGIQAPLVKLGIVTYDEENYKGIFCVFTTSQPVLETSFSLDPKEIQCVQALGREELLQMIKEHPEHFSPTFLTVLSAIQLELKTIRR